MDGVPPKGLWSWTEWNPLTIAVSAALFVAGAAATWAMGGTGSALRFGITVGLVVSAQAMTRRWMRRKGSNE